MATCDIRLSKIIEVFFIVIYLIVLQIDYILLDYFPSMYNSTASLSELLTITKL